MSLQRDLSCNWTGTKSWGTGRTQWEEIKILLLLWTEPFLSGYIRDVFVPGLLKVCLSFAPLGHAKGKFFIFLLCSMLYWLLVLFLSVLLALSRFSLALCLFLLSSKDQTVHTLQQFSWCVESDCRLVSCLIPLLWGIKSQGETEEKRLDGTRRLPFYSHFYLFLFIFPPLGTSSVGLKTAVVYSWKFHIGSGKTTCFEKLSM